MKKVAIGTIIVVILVVVAFWTDIRAKVLFSRLWLNRKDTAVAQKIADRLAESKAGIRICVNDIGVYGGKTQGWSSYVVRNNKLPDYTHEQVDNLLSHDISLSQRVEAYILLWETEKDIAYLVKLYDCVRTAVDGEMALPAERGYGRNFLLKLFGKSPDAEAIFDKPSNEELELSPDEFKIFAEQYFAEVQSAKHGVSNG